MNLSTLISTSLASASSPTNTRPLASASAGVIASGAFLSQSADTEVPQHYFDGGFTFLITDNIQYDIRGGVGLNDAADDYFVGTGLSVRFK